MAPPRVVAKLVLDNGSCPIDEWRRGIRDKMTRARILRRIDRLGRGNFGDYKDFDGIGELRLDFGPGYRVYFVRQGSVVVILLGGGDKGSQKRDILAARERWEAFQKSGVDMDSFPLWGDDE